MCRHEQLQDLELLGIRGQFHDQRNVWQVGIFPEGRLGDNVDLLLRDPALALGLDRGPVDAADAVEFATLEWVDWLNNRRLLEPIGNIPPAEAEERHYAMLNERKLAA